MSVIVVIQSIQCSDVRVQRDTTTLKKKTKKNIPPECCCERKRNEGKIVVVVFGLQFYVTDTFNTLLKTFFFDLV